MLAKAPNFNKGFKYFILAFALVAMTACTSTWKAPVYTHSQPEKKTTVQQRVATPINGTYYKVASGDTLYSIAWRTGRDYRDLARWNRLGSPYTIYVGQVLRIKPYAKKVQKTIPKKTPKKETATQKRKTATTTSKTPVAAENYKSRLYWQWPTRGKLIKGFAKGDDTKKGIVVSGKHGQAIKAAEAGKIVYSGSGLIGYGQLIIIKHNNNYLSAYGHNRRLLVKEGDWVTKGKKIAEMGMNEKKVPALHFEIRKNGNPLNPVKVLPRRN